MCIVIDANVWCCVFRPDGSHHADYSAVLQWITLGQGFIVYGGSKYRQELRRAPRYLPIFLELRKQGRAKEINQAVVDTHEVEVKRVVDTPQCDDTHLIAIFRASGCRLLCSNDQRADVYIKNPRYYLPRQKPPSIYRSAQHRPLLCQRNIVRIRNQI